MKARMSLWFSACLAIAVLGLASGASAQSTPTVQPEHFLSGGDLLKGCAKDATAERRSLCQGYIAGIADYMIAAMPRNQGMTCIPSHTAQAQIVDVVLNYVKQAPERLSQSGAEVTVTAIMRNWHCGG